MRRVIFTPSAEDDVDDAKTWYAAQREGLDHEFRTELDRKIADIGERPHAFPVWHKDVRKALLRRFPYQVFFYEDADDLVVIAVHHHKRHPSHWKRRR